MLAFPYDADLVEQARAIQGRHFDRHAKANVFPFTSLPQVVALADAYGIDVAPEVRALVPVATSRVGQQTARHDVHTEEVSRADAQSPARAGTADDESDDDPGASPARTLRTPLTCTCATACCPCQAGRQGQAVAAVGSERTAGRSGARPAARPVQQRGDVGVEDDWMCGKRSGQITAARRHERPSGQRRDLREGRPPR